MRIVLVGILIVVMAGAVVFFFTLMRDASRDYREPPEPDFGESVISDTRSSESFTRTKDPTPFLEVPPFELIDQTGQPFGSDNLAGKVWVGNFFFTTCDSTCPKQVAKLAAIYDSLREDGLETEVQLVSFSIDPEVDTQETLREFATEQNADDQVWKFLTGPRDDIWKLCRDGFKLRVGENPPEADLPVYHSDKLILVDRKMRVRGVYRGASDDEPTELLEALEAALEEDEG